MRKVGCVREKFVAFAFAHSFLLTDYFCSFKELMYKQNYRNFEDILIIAPDFNYEYDDLVQ